MFLSVLSASSHGVVTLSNGTQKLMSKLAGSIALAILVVFNIRAIKPALLNVLSMATTFVLLRLYPIRHMHGRFDLPSLPYKFPNGQGNVEKFLRGRENSAKWECEYGSIYRLWTGMNGEVVLTRPDHVEAVFRDSHNHIKAHASDSGYLMDCLLGSCLGLVSGLPWEAVKSGTEAPFRHQSVKQYTEDVQDFTRAYMHRLAKENCALGQQGKLHPVLDLKLLPLLFVAKTIYGSLNQSLERELLDLIPLREALFKRIVDGGINRFSICRYLPFLPSVRALNDFKMRWAEWNDRAFASALLQDTSRTGSPKPIIAMYRVVEDGTMSREQLLQTLDEILFANIDVTIGGLSWTLVFLAAYPVMQKRVREEIRGQSSTSEKINRKKYLYASWSTTPTLLGACILEAARLRPLAAFSVPQSCPTPRFLDGFNIPPGTNYVIDSYALNVRDPFWGPDRESFRPERWLEPQMTKTNLRYRYWRFGFGPRNCLGKYLADLILRAVIVEILDHWHLSLGFDEERQACEGSTPSPETGHKIEKSNEGEEWAWDDEKWIHSPDFILKCARCVT